MTEAEPLLGTVKESLGEAVLDSHAYRGDATILVAPESLQDVLLELRDGEKLRFNLLMDLTAVDYIEREPRFELVYHLAAIDVEPRGTEPCRMNQRLRVKAGVPADPCEVDSVVEIFPSADWMEREVWDMYGISFRGHPNLKRVLLYEEFKGHPLRKDYPKERRQPLIGPRN
ncbi:MAG: NADH-quinone oxidoreductase subunit C [bacterium]|nr:NADH-quinone oxidoreductase subunit C [bacterium]